MQRGFPSSLSTLMAGFEDLNLEISSVEEKKEEHYVYLPISTKTDNLRPFKPLVKLYVKILIC